MRARPSTPLRPRCWTGWTRRAAGLAEATRIALQDRALIPLYWETTIWAYKDRYRHAGRVDQATDADGLAPKE